MRHHSPCLREASVYIDYGVAGKKYESLKLDVGVSCCLQSENMEVILGGSWVVIPVSVILLFAEVTPHFNIL